MKSTDRRYRRNESDVIRRGVYELPTVTRSLSNAARIMWTERAAFHVGSPGSAARDQPAKSAARDEQTGSATHGEPTGTGAHGEPTWTGARVEPSGHIQSSTLIRCTLERLYFGSEKCIDQFPLELTKTSPKSISLNIENELCFDKQKVAEYFNDYFKSIASSLVEKLPPCY